MDATRLVRAGETVTLSGVKCGVATHVPSTATLPTRPPETRPILGVKSSVHFRADFAPIGGAILVTAAPGPVAVDPSALPRTRIDPTVRLRPLGPTLDRRR